MKKGFFLILLSCVGPFALLQAQSEITNVVTIPLYHPATGDQSKWGIYLSVGGGGTPALFELDTGGTGFYAAYATNGTSPWWGTELSTNNANGTNAYDSGLTYTGNVVSTGVSFWTNSNAEHAAVASPTNVLVGQSTLITKGTSTYWTEAGTASNPAPPINGAFYGDFGLALNSASNALVNIIAQMTFTNGILPGFLINAPLTGPNGYLQIGLTAAQTNAPGFSYFAMNPDTNGAGTFNNNTGIGYKSEQLFNAMMTLTNRAGSVYSANIGITPDTGATPKLHNTTNDPDFPSDWIIDGGTQLRNDLSFSLSATNTAVTLTEITKFTTTNSGEDYASNTAVVSVQNSNSIYTDYYYNTGLYLFNQHQVVYDLQNGTIGFGPTPVPEPSVTWLLLSGFGVLLTVSLHRKIRR